LLEADGGDQFALAGGLGSDGTLDAPEEENGEVAKVVQTQDLNASLRLEGEEEEEEEAPLEQVASTPEKPKKEVVRTQLDVLDASPARQLFFGVPLMIAGVGSLVLGVLIFMAGGSLEPLYVIGSQMGWNPPPGHTVKNLDEVYLTRTRSVTYTGGAKGPILVLTGTAVNSSNSAQQQLKIVSKLRDRSGNVVAEQTAPLGMQMEVADIHNIDSRESFASLIAHKAQTQGEPTLDALQESTFVVVFAPPPEHPEKLYHDLQVTRGDLVLPPPAPEPEPEIEEERPRRRRKGRRGRKGRKRGKRRRAE